MKIKHKVIKEFQYLSPDKKIFILKTGTILEAYTYKVKSEDIPIDKEIIDNNPEFFEIIDWKMELISFIKINKMPQPAQLSKKLIPFIEDMIITSIQTEKISNNIDPNLVKNINIKEDELNLLKNKLQIKETNLDNRERRIKDIEDELDIRSKRIEKKENEHKLDIQTLNKKDDDLRLRNRECTEKELDIQDKINELNEKERNINRTSLLSTQEIDIKYKELQNKINIDMQNLSDREKTLNTNKKELKEKQADLEKNILEITNSNKNKIYTDLENEFRGLESDIRNIDMIASELNNFNHPIVIESTNKLIELIKKVKERVDNNIIN